MCWPASPALNLVIDGQSVTGWRQAEARADSGLSITGAMADGDRSHPLTITQVADRAAFEFALTLRNTGGRVVRVSTADAFAGTLAPAAWQGLSFTSKCGEEFEPEHFALEAPREIEIRTGRSSLGQSPLLGASSPLGAVLIAPVWSGNWHIGIPPGRRRCAAQCRAVAVEILARPAAWNELRGAPSVLVAVGADLEDAAVALTRAVGATLPRSVASEAIPPRVEPLVAV